MSYSTITIEGGLFSPDLLERIASEGDSIYGQKPSDFGLAPSRSVMDQMHQAYSAARKYWDAFSARLDHSRVSPVTLTRQDWATKFYELLDYPQLQYQQSGLEAGGTSFPISYLTGAWENAAPIHIVGIDQDLDHRANQRRTPHSLIQDYLNRSEALWGMVTNGAKLRSSETALASPNPPTWSSTSRR